MIMGFWRHAVRRVPLRYDPQFWALVFPLGMYSVATTKMIAALGLSFGGWIPAGAFWVAATAWTITSVGMVLAERPRFARST